jgi:hypothetical protein
MGNNDLFGNSPADAMGRFLESATAPYRGRGVRCHAVTITPRSHSGDGWIGATNQQPSNAPAEQVRRDYNAWLRGHWKAAGLAGIFDIAHAVDPSDSGLWSFDPGATAAPHSVAGGFASVAGGRVTAIAPARYTDSASSGRGYLPGSRVACVVQNYPATPGSGAAAHAEIGADGRVGRFVVDAPGAGYEQPPMIGLAGPWTGDGVHPSARGFNEMIARAGIGPNVFAL